MYSDTGTRQALRAPLLRGASVLRCDSRSPGGRARGKRGARESSHRLSDGVGTNGVLTEGGSGQALFRCRSATNLLHSAILFECACHKQHPCCHILLRFPMNIYHGKSRHLCDDPGCPDPVWKLSKPDIVPRGARPSDSPPAPVGSCTAPDPA